MTFLSCLSYNKESLIIRQQMTYPVTAMKELKKGILHGDALGSHRQLQGIHEWNDAVGMPHLSSVIICSDYGCPCCLSILLSDCGVMFR